MSTKNDASLSSCQPENSFTKPSKGLDSDTAQKLMCSGDYSKWAVRYTAEHTSGEGAEHAEGGAGDAVHVGQGEGDVDDDGQHEGGHNARLIAERQAEDDVGGRAGAAGLRNGLQPQVFNWSDALVDENRPSQCKDNVKQYAREEL